MNIPRDKFWAWVNLFLIAVNIGIFLYLNHIPLKWIQHETLLYRFYWSMDGPNQFSLHTGFNFYDFIKPFDCFYNDGIFRMRQFSYLTDMLSFKFWQYWEKGFFRNYTYIFIHLVNVGLVGWLIFSLTRRREPAIVGMLLALNSGIALATLLFPFRNAKLLIVTLFLIAWVMIVNSPGKFRASSPRRLFIFSLIILLALFTDEIAFFVLPLLLVYIVIRDGKEGLFNRRILLYALGTVVLFLILTYVFFIIYLNMTETRFYDIKFKDYFWKWGTYFTDLRTPRDVGNAFLNYFLRKNFGFWDATLPGRFSALAFLVLLILGIKSWFKSSVQIKQLVWVILGIIFLKAFLLPHDSGVHSLLMPTEAFFPTLLFFGYYYTYVDAILLVVLVSLSLNAFILDAKKLLFLLIALTIISISNFGHLKEGPKDALVFHDWNKESMQESVGSILKTREMVSSQELWPIYLSFTSGNEALLKGRRYDGLRYLYARIIPVMYLRSIEQGRVIISLENAKAKNSFPTPYELLNAKYFLDCVSGVLYDLRKIKQQYGVESLIPREMEAPLTINAQKTNRPVDHVVFFIKGEAKFVLTYNGQQVNGDQYYGHSYQMFFYKADSPGFICPVDLKLTISPKYQNQEIYVVGPFISEQD